MKTQTYYLHHSNYGYLSVSRRGGLFAQYVPKSDKAKKFTLISEAQKVQKDLEKTGEPSYKFSIKEN